MEPLKGTKMLLHKTAMYGGRGGRNKIQLVKLCICGIIIEKQNSLSLHSIL